MIEPRAASVESTPISEPGDIEMAVKPIREGFHTVTPYLFAEGAAG